MFFKKNKTTLKAVLTYWGGKQKLTKEIIPRLYHHNCYVEPYCGGAAVLFAKTQSKVEVINDINKEITNFYQVARNESKAFIKKIECTLYTRDTHYDAVIIYNSPHLFSPLNRAWAVWVLSHQSFNSNFKSSFAYSRKSKITTTFISKKRDFNSKFLKRIEHLQIETGDAIDIIPRYDSEDTLFYCDPPYYQADMGHYSNYYKKEFEDLLETLSKIKGKFMLSSYPSEILFEYINKNKWYYDNFIQTLSTSQYKSKYKKTEVITTNYDMSSI